MEKMYCELTNNCMGGCCFDNDVAFGVPNKSSFVTGEYKKYNYPGGFNKITEDGIENFYIEKVIYRAPATIVMWSDGTKTVSKCCEHDTYSPHAGLIYCIAKKLTSATKIHDIIHSWSNDDIGKTIEVENEDGTKGYSKIVTTADVRKFEDK